MTAARRAAGREELPFEVTVQDGGGRGRDSYLRLRDAGATRILVGPPQDHSGRLTPEGCRAWAARFGEEVIDRIN